ncbi:MAG: hypothetical protein JW922_10590 [Paludibacteraceae bacterium]|nr:hypothetical protein [Paludibacteraceae bacterium]
MSASINLLEPEFIEGYWTSDKEGKQPLKSTNLGETVYFHVKTKDIPDGHEIMLKLYEQDKNIFMCDYCDPDDKKFPEEEVVKKATVKNNKATVELVLQENWEVMVADDHDNAGSLDQSLELYWLASFRHHKKELPTNDNDYLRVGYSERDLFFKTPIASHNLPELKAYDGSPILLMRCTELDMGDLKDEAINIFGKKIDSAITNIALTKLEKGTLVSNTGKITVKNSQIYTRDIYTNEGKLLEDVKIRKNYGNKTVTTKGISQFDYFSNVGTRVKVLGFLKQVSSAIDVFDFIKVLQEGGPNTSKALSIELGSLTPLWDLAGILVDNQKAELDMWLEEVVQQEIDNAKLQGIEATRIAIRKWNHNKEYKWDILDVSAVTANKLLRGEFKTFEELESYGSVTGELISKISILYRRVENKSRKGRSNYIIETIFINE